MLACSGCGSVQLLPALPPRAEALCHRCAEPLRRTAGRSIDAALACALTLLLLLLAANVLPLLRVRALGVSRESVLVSGAIAMLRDRQVLVALAVLLFAVILPLARAALLVLVLGALRLGRSLPRAGALFRVSDELRPWAMPSVALLALFFAYTRISEQKSAAIHMEIGPGAWCLAAAVLLSFVTDSALDRRAVWSEIGPEPPLAPGDDGVPCERCELIVPGARPGDPCPRCGHRLARARPGSLRVAAALVVTASILYVPSYAYPMGTELSPKGFRERTIIDAIQGLFRVGMWYWAIVIIVASVVIPLFKLFGLGWILWRVRWPEPRRRLLRARLFRLLHEVGPWSMTDPFIIATTAPLLAFKGLVEVHATTAILPFLLVVVLTMLATRSFDPRLMWDAPGEVRRDG